MLAREFVKFGHEVQLVTNTSGDNTDIFPFEVTRRPGPVSLILFTRWCDVMFHNNISLQMAWPLLFVHRPWVVAHHTWIPTGRGLNGLKGSIKQWALRRADCISISQAVARSMDTPSTLIPNPYDSAVFRKIEGIERKNDIVFVGRLVTDKGVDVLLHAIHMLKQAHGVVTQLTIIGDGPEFEALTKLTADLGIGSLIRFTGHLKDEVLAREVNAHAVMVVPSQWNEPFGIVALEGIACGCVVVATSGGGLPDAVGPCGVTFPRGDSISLASILADLLQNEQSLESFTTGATEHLEKHRIQNVAASYLEVIEHAMRKHPCH